MISQLTISEGGTLFRYNQKMEIFGISFGGEEEKWYLCGGMNLNGGCITQRT